MPDRGEQIITANGFDQAGINRDTPAVLLGPNQFTDARNVIFHDGAVSKRRGAEQILQDLQDESGTALTDVEFVEYWNNPNLRFYVYGNDTNAYLVDASNNVQLISTTAFTSGGSWNFSFFGGGRAIVLNKGNSTPQYLIDNTDDGQGLALADLPGWIYGSFNSITAGVIAGYDNVLVAGDLELNDGTTITRAPGTIRISSQAAIGSIPQSWEPGALSNKDTADEFEPQ